MPHYRCCVSGCNNDSRYVENQIKRGHVAGDLKWHYFPKDPEKRTAWSTNISKGLVDFVASDHKTVCSNHFEYGKPTYASPVPTLFLSIWENNKPSPRRRKLPLRHKVDPQKSKVSVSLYEDSGVQCAIIDRRSASSMTFTQLTKERDVRFYTGMASADAPRLLFEHLQPKAMVMHYWKGEKDARKLDRSKPRFDINPRALSLEQEFLLCLMRLRQGFAVEDLAFRFGVSDSTVSSVFTTWLKLMSKELSWIVLWPDRCVVKRNLPEMFRKYYPKCRVIIDCTEIHIETPSDLQVAAMCWSNYKQHYTIKFLVGITPNGAVSYVSDIFGGRASDIFIVGDCGFLGLLQPFDEVMADRGFKIHDLLAFHQCFLSIPPSKHSNLQMSVKDVKGTSKIANVRIYVEQAIKRIKDYYILKRELPISLLPLADDLVVVCAALSNLQEPLSL